MKEIKKLQECNYVFQFIDQFETDFLEYEFNELFKRLGLNVRAEYNRESMVYDIINAEYNEPKIESVEPLLFSRKFYDEWEEDINEDFAEMMISDYNEWKGREN